MGPRNDGVRDVHLSRVEEPSRSKVSPGTVPLARARTVVDAIDDDAPWYTRIDFVDAIAALTAPYSEEAQRKVTGRRSVVTACSVTQRFLCGRCRVDMHNASTRMHAHVYSKCSCVAL